MIRVAAYDFMSAPESLRDFQWELLCVKHKAYPNSSIIGLFTYIEDENLFLVQLPILFGVLPSGKTSIGMFDKFSNDMLFYLYPSDIQCMSSANLSAIEAYIKGISSYYDDDIASNVTQQIKHLTGSDSVEESSSVGTKIGSLFSAS